MEEFFTSEFVIKAIAILAGFFGCTNRIPQIIRLYKIKKARHISLTMVILSICESLLWILYAVLTNTEEIVWAHLITLTAKSWVLVLRIHYAKDVKKFFKKRKKRIKKLFTSKKKLEELDALKRQKKAKKKKRTLAKIS